MRIKLTFLLIGRLGFSLQWGSQVICRLRENYYTFLYYTVGIRKSNDNRNNDFDIGNKVNSNYCNLTIVKVLHNQFKHTQKEIFSIDSSSNSILIQKCEIRDSEGVETILHLFG